MIETKKPRSTGKAIKDIKREDIKIQNSPVSSYRKTEHCPDPDLMDWTSQHLPNSKTFFITDVDLVIRDIRGKTEHLMFVEVKRFKAKSSPHQRTTFDILHKIIRAGLKVLRFRVWCKNGILHQIKYHGFHLLQFERTGFNDGLVYWNGQPVSEQRLIELLSFK